MQMKRDKLKKFVEKAVDDEVTRMKLTRKIRRIKDEKEEDQILIEKAEIINPDLNYLESLYNPEIEE
jgi:hypothetical protein